VGYSLQDHSQTKLALATNLSRRISLFFFDWGERLTLATLFFAAIPLVSSHSNWDVLPVTRPHPSIAPSKL
jgi:hypothetical protein